MNFYAHTAQDREGKPLPESSGKWQLLSAHLRNVAKTAKKFAQPFGLSEEAQLAGLLHDFGEYADWFQARLCNTAIHGINHCCIGMKTRKRKKAQHSALCKYRRNLGPKASVD